MNKKGLLLRPFPPQGEALPDMMLFQVVKHLLYILILLQPIH